MIFWSGDLKIFDERRDGVPKYGHFRGSDFQKSNQKVWKTQNFQKTKKLSCFFVHKIMLTEYEVVGTLRLGYLAGKKCRQAWTFSKFCNIAFLMLEPAEMLQRTMGFHRFPEFRPTLTSCISELSEYFPMGPVPFERSMSKLSNEPNTIKNGHLTRKLRAIEDSNFSENSLSQHQTLLSSPLEQLSDTG